MWCMKCLWTFQNCCVNEQCFFTCLFIPWDILTFLGQSRDNCSSVYLNLGESVFQLLAKNPLTYLHDLQKFTWHGKAYYCASGFWGLNGSALQCLVFSRFSGTVLSNFSKWTNEAYILFRWRKPEILYPLLTVFNPQNMQFKMHETWTLQLRGEKRVLEREKVKWEKNRSD